MEFMSSIVWIILTFLILWISYRYLTAPENPWKKAGIPQVSRWDALISAITLNAIPLHLGMQQNYKKYGKLFGSSMFGKLTLYIGDPELLRRVLVKDFQHFINRLDIITGDSIMDNMMLLARGEKWKRIRNITSPTFSTGKIKKMTSIILDCVESLEKNFDKDASSKTPSDVKKLVSAFSMDVIASTAFGIKIDSHNDPDNAFMKATMKMFSFRAQMKMMISMKINKMLRYLHLSPTISNYLDFFKTLGKNMIEERKRSGQVRNDLLQLMLEASDVNSSPAMHTPHTNDNVDHSNEIIIKDMGTKPGDALTKDQKGLSQDEIISQCITFLLGGFEAIASAISFTLYELALNENIQEKLVSEIDEVLRKNQETLTYENVQTMKYLDSVVSETLRKYPPVIFILRQCTSDYTASDRNLDIPKGTSIVVPIHAMHHDPEYFPNPDTYDPERFHDEDKSQHDPYVYLPFGTGPRNCIAMRFALIEVKLCLAHLLSQLRFRKCAKTLVPLKFQSMVPHIIAQNIFLTVEKRKDALVLN